MKTMHTLRTVAQGAFMFALILGSTALHAATAERVDGKAAFAKMKSLAGDWTGPKMMGTRMKTNYRVIAGGSAVMASFFPGTKNEMVTVYYLKGDDLVQTHYCMLGNQPRMKYNPKKSTADTLVFDFDGGDNLKSTKMHMHSETLHLVGRNKIESMCTSMEHGKPEAKCTSVLVRS